MRTIARGCKSLGLIGGLLTCFSIAGCSAETGSPPGAAVSSSQSATLIVPSLSQDQAVAALEQLLGRIRDLRKKMKAVGGLGYTLDTSSNRVTKIDLRAEFDLGCGCCGEDVCSEVTDQDLLCFGCFDALEVLKIPNAALKGDGLIAIRDLKSLRELDLSLNPMHDDALKHLAKLQSLESLELNATDIDGEGLRHLVGLPRLTRLSVQNCRLSPEGWAALGSLTQLKHLSVTAATIPGDPEDRHLRHLALLRSLESVRIGTYVYPAGAINSSGTVSMNHVPAKADRVFRWLGSLPKLKKIESSSDFYGLTQEGIRHFSDPAPLESLNLSVTICPEEFHAPGGSSAGRVLARFDNLTSLRVDCRQLPATPSTSVEIGNMDSLEFLELVTPERAGECYLHDLPKLQRLQIAGFPWGFLRKEPNAKELPEPCFQRVRLTNLPRLHAVTMAIPSELVVRNVATQRVAGLIDSTWNDDSAYGWRLYGRLTNDVARALASVEGLKRLELLPHRESTPQALAAFRDHPTLTEIGMRIDDSPRAWIESISGLRDTLETLELPPQSLGYDISDRGTPLDTETLAPLANMLRLKELTLANVIDPDGEPISWVSDLPHLERLVVSKHDIGRFHVRLSQAAARWQVRQGRIGTLEVSRWPETSSVVNLADTWTTNVRARQSGQASCQIDVSSHVRHYVFRDLPHVTQIRLQGKTAQTIRLEGDLSSLNRIQDEYLDAELIIAPTAKIGDVSRDRR